jgi:predicted membrane protein
MGFLFSGMFWGVFLILIGVVMILNMIFGIRIPVFRILFALFLIFWGISMLTGINFRGHGRNTAVFERKDIAADGTHNDYSVVFGKSTVDLSSVKLEDAVKRVRVSTVFGGSTVLIDKAMPVRIRISSAFAGARLPDGNVISFGDYTYMTDSLKPDTKAYLLVEASTVFGEMEIIAK